MNRTLIFFEILCMIFFLLFSSADKRTQFLTSLAGPGMLSLVKQASAIQWGAGTGREDK